MDSLELLLDQVREALVRRQPLRIRGGDTKAHLGRKVDGEALDVSGHRGLVHYDPTELVATVRTGTPLAELNAALAEHGQMLPCEPPRLGEGATVGGTLACGLSGPRRPWSGSLRDFVLGTRLITGTGEHLRFGGEVMKNVAGYDVSRLLAGSQGCLGVITEVSFKVLPKPRCTQSLSLELDAERALQRLAVWGREALPISAACHDGQHLHLRLEGGEGSVRSATDRLGGETLADAFWDDLNEQRLAFFQGPAPLWRLSVPVNTPLLDLPGTRLLDWGGAQYWLKSDAPATVVREIAERAGGHALCYTPDAEREAQHPLPAALLDYHRRLKARLDPQGIFNPGRLYAGL
ncbi:glycolate oxidase subunit GlcE [Pseudomonas rhizoryzae]|uniref:glycolate oxidase subunit GlcE n=1 Tax=Pseudomonas rhizoryzae TaxID=2571129 RepID=UPI00073626E6|nr:glycolate oxidase subunit GlcE [Pseudomonas rhizoryzae]KTS98818.1 glycolate oxidase [Pseudomonas psychrotolerans]KTT23784.1 glycolate oxidase [Pseudomonas psychrotolerans]KTT30427.1 glycolate oxidase [Pseudomonas psychrotolerans]KTT36845.1 glycolate oxidase [Pseudomonas psychrotolerans]KTT55469.1 glycolate oxidase [Pseudomonas psychrotolerans]